MPADIDALGHIGDVITSFDDLLDDFDLDSPEYPPLLICTSRCSIVTMRDVH
jgi:hypothetical protein